MSEIQGEHPNITGTHPLQLKRLGQIGLSFGERRLMRMVSEAPRQFFFNFVLKAEIWAHMRVFKTQMAENEQFLVHISSSFLSLAVAL